MLLFSSLENLLVLVGFILTMSLEYFWGKLDLLKGKFDQSALYFFRALLIHLFTPMKPIPCSFYRLYMISICGETCQYIWGS